MLLGILNAQAAGGSAYEPAFDLLETVNTSASSVTFTGLGAYSDYKHLQLRGTIRATRASYDTDLRLRMNGSVAYNYAFHGLRGTGSTVNTESTSGQNYITAGKFPGSVDASDNFAAVTVDILDFSSTTKNTTIRTFLGTAGDFEQVSFYGGLYALTSALTSFAIFPESNAFASGTRLSLYGVK